MRTLLNAITRHTLNDIDRAIHAQLNRPFTSNDSFWGRTTT